MKLSAHRFRFVAGLIALMAGSATLRAAELIEKTWFFTTDHTLTIDVRLAAAAEPDWAASAVTIAPVPGGQVVHRALDPKFVTASPTPGVQRIVLDHLDVAAWSPIAPNLYRVTLDLTARSGRREKAEQRVGFRAFTTRDGQLLLNGRPTFLRGLAINPPNRGIPEALERSRGFAEDYVRYLLGLHVNIIRIPDDDTWYDVCDELGMMVFGGNYSGRINGAGSDGNRAAAVRWFREEKFHPLTHHPSLVIYALTNEVAYSGPSGQRWDDFLREMHRQLQPWDPTRLYIANAGYGYGRVGEINDLHRYWGWYYETPYTFLHLRDYPQLVFPEKTQPLTFTECVGNYNGPDGRVNLTPNHKNPPAQQNWTGHAPTAEQGTLEYEHQSFTIRQATELFRRLRPANPELSGVFPFTILFNRWHDITRFADMGPKPAAEQLRASYQPVLLSWECYTPNAYAGAELRPIAHIVNDAEDGNAIRGARLRLEVCDANGRAVATHQTAIPDVAYYGTTRIPLTVKIPAGLATGRYTLRGVVEHNGRTLSENRTELFIAAESFSRGVGAASRVRLFDAGDLTTRALAKVGVPASRLATELNSDSLSAEAGPVVIGEDSVGKLPAAAAAALRGYVQRGGRLVVLRQAHAAADALARLLPIAVRLPATDIDDPAYPPPPRPARNSFNINPERPEHPIFGGIDRRMLHVWSDYTGWDERQKGLPHIYPVTDGFVIANKADIESTAVLANYGPGLEGNAIAEIFAGEGSVLVCAFDLAARAGLDPVADRLLGNLLAYAAQREGHERYPLIEAPIVWGQYETERGVLTGINSGLMLNSRPRLTGSYRDIPITVTKDGHEFAGGAGGWNSRPGIVYEPFGRRPFGPYIHRVWSGVPTPESDAARTRAAATEPAEDAEAASGTGGEGEGRFWCRIPAGKTRVVHRIFNPSKESLTLRCRANGREATTTIAAGATENVTVAFATATTVENFVRGDRRLVLLQTTFE